MIKMEVVMNDEKISADDKFDLQGVYDVVRKVYEDEGLKYNAEDKCFYGNDDEHDLAKFFICANKLEECNWFLQNVKIWLFYEWYKKDESDLSIEDWLKD